MKDYNESYSTLKRRLKRTSGNGQAEQYYQMAKPPKLMYGSNAIPIKSPTAFIKNLKKTTLKTHMDLEKN